jgi:hypothetical protein
VFDKYTKAIVGALVAALGAYQTALLDNAVAPVEWIGVIITFLTAAGVIWGVPNSGTSPVVTQPQGSMSVQLSASTSEAPTTTNATSNPETFSRVPEGGPRRRRMDETPDTWEHGPTNPSQKDIDRGLLD